MVSTLCYNLHYWRFSQLFFVLRIFLEGEVVVMERVKASFISTRTFLREVIGELYKVVWPGWGRTLKLTGVVILMVAIVSGYLLILDTPLAYGMERLLKRG